MENDMKFRHEFKYRCDSAEIEIMRHRLNILMKPDRHAGENGYCIRSLYFDNYSNQCIWENESGTDNRCKYRIRIYNADQSRIALEEKSKKHAMTYKQACLITREQFGALMRGESLPDMQGNNALLNRFIYLVKTQMMRPAVIVEYDRIPYVCGNGNVRVTLDMNIRSSMAFDGFFEKNIPTRQILPSGQHLLEVKYDELLPDYIRQALALGDLQQTSFSKYYLCRKKSFGGLL